MLASCVSAFLVGSALKYIEASQNGFGQTFDLQNSANALHPEFLFSFASKLLKNEIYFAKCVFMRPFGVLFDTNLVLVVDAITNNSNA